MTDQHRATPEQWAAQEKWASPPDSDPYALCLLELRARVEALEKAQRPARTPAVEHVLDLRDRIQMGSITLADALAEIGVATTSISEAMAPVVRLHNAMEASRDPSAGSLVWRVAALVANFASEGLPGDDAMPTARAAIREVAAWLRETGDNIAIADAMVLEQEANR